ncbi:MAG TPA: hypothetical protein VKB38_04105 [Terracidiphilus sp.]|nr:hypothetical protein [Terracidiphilus sp.]
MKHGFAKAFSVAAVSLAIAWPGLARSQTPADQGTQDQNSATRRAGGQEANEMVRATVALTKPLDAKKDQQGSQFEAKLQRTVHLKNGPELPKGTLFVGKVTTDDMQEQGSSKLAVQFTEAKLKNGSSVPVHATIMQLYPPEGLTTSGSPIPQDSTAITEADGNTNNWTDQQTRVDQIGALKNVDLHSSVASRNSGVFVSTKSSDVKIMQGSQMELALAAANNGERGANSGPGMK